MPFSDIALKILKKRYYLKDKDGNNVENSPEEVFQRVAKYIASAEEKYDHKDKDKIEEIFYKAMINQELMPASPIIFNAGTSNPMLSSCFKKGTIIETDNGPTPIEEIKIGDCVLTHKGRYRKVLNTSNREDFLVEIKIDKLPKMYTTIEHPFLTTEGFKKVSDLKNKKDFVVIGNIDSKEIPVYINIDGVEKEGFIYQELSESTKKNRKRELNLQMNPVKANIEIDEDVAWLLGLYLSEGSISGKSGGDTLSFTLAVNELDIAEELQEILKNKFGLTATIDDARPKHNWLQIRTSSKLLCSWLIKNFNKGATKKVLPKWVFNLPFSVKECLLKGIDIGDGTISNLHHRRITLANEKLVRQIFLLAKNLGYNPTLNMEFAGKLSRTQPWSVYFGPTFSRNTFIKNGAYRVHIVKKLDIKDIVYNISVEEDNTYIANQIVVHNCFGFEVEDSIESILKILTDSAIIFKRGGGVGWNMSKLRSKGTSLSSGGESSGVCSFISLYNTMIETIKQGGKRRGAGAVILDATHPDIFEFIKFKRDGSWNNLNISVICTDNFMSKIDSEYKYIWNEIIESNWQEGDPNIIFIDTMNKNNTLPKYPINVVNPCFTGNTKITVLENGREIKVPIKNVKVGDIVKSYNIKTYEIEYKKVLASGKTRTQKMSEGSLVIESVIRMNQENIHILHTPDHKFYNGHGKYKPIKVKDHVFVDGLSWMCEVREQRIPETSFETIHVYDITVEDNHNFFAEDILVSNCHEIAMSSYESCNLAGINLDKCVKGSKDNIKTDWDKLGKLIKLGHRFLDDMIDVNAYPLPEIKEFALKTRRQGLYVFGLAPALLRLGLRYGSQESLDYIDNLFNFINRVSLETCVKLGKIRGDFPEFKESTYYKKYKHMRCSHRLTIAPSGTTSRIADSYFSIEPYYAFDYISNIMDDSIEETISLKEEYQDLYPEAIVTAYDITPEEHLLVMSTIQKYIDQSISKTINLPNSATKEDIDKIFRRAYELGLKCVTTFRNGCKDKQVLEIRQPMECKNGVCDI